MKLGHGLRSACAAVGMLLLAAVSQAGIQNDDNIELLAPGEPVLALRESAAADWLTKERWYALRLAEGHLHLQPVRSIRKPDWLKQEYSTTQTEGDSSDKSATAEFKPEGVALDLPADSLFALRIQRDGTPRPIPHRAQGYPSLIPAPVTLTENWSTRFRLGGQPWIVRTQYQRRVDGSLLAGSMSLHVRRGQDEEGLLLPPATGMAFSRQELLWLGDLDQDGRPDALLRRIWITGEQDYVVIIGDHFSGLYVDTDYPQRAFSSGVEESAAVRRHVSQNALVLPASFDGPRFSVSMEEWRTAMDANDKDRPFVIADRQLKLGTETLRFSLEYLPRYRNDESERGIGTYNFWSGPVLVRVTFRGRPQVLLQIGELDDSNLDVQIGVVDGQPVIKLEYYPHYNNGLGYYWLYSESEKRFRRVLVDHSQGC